MQRTRTKRFLRFVLGLAAMTVVTEVLGLVRAGDLEPSAAPAPTFKTLDEIPPTWSQILPADDGDPVTGCNSSRFECVMEEPGGGPRAVLDKETGLVWQRFLSSNTWSNTGDWTNARWTCANSREGGRRGWRLSSVFELVSLFGSFSLPDGHPFVNYSGGHFWSATTDSSVPTRAWGYQIVIFSGGGAVSGVTLLNKTERQLALCVRGGLNADQY